MTAYAPLQQLDDTTFEEVVTAAKERIQERLGAEWQDRGTFMRRVPQAAETIADLILPLMIAGCEEHGTALYRCQCGALYESMHPVCPSCNGIMRRLERAG